MPQSFHIIRCFSCNVFQVHIVKKSSRKWDCKMCGAKQSLKKVYGEGTARQCREIVQKLNMAGAESPSEHILEHSVNQDAENCGVTWAVLDEAKDDMGSEEEALMRVSEAGYGKRKFVPESTHEQSKWAKFLSTADNKINNTGPTPEQVHESLNTSGEHFKAHVSLKESTHRDKVTDSARNFTWLQYPAESDEQIDELLNWDL